MVARWRAGADVVYAQRRARAGENAFKKITSWLFYRVIDRLSDVHIPRDVGDFRLMSARVVEAVRRFEENPRFMRGLVSWVGFKQEAMPYDRDARHAGETKYHLRQLLKLSTEAIAAFSLKPLKLTVYMGMFTILVAVALTAMIVVQKLVTGEMPFKGYALLTCSVFFLGGVQLLMLGILAHYLGHVFKMSQRRPLYLVAESRGVGISAESNREHTVKSNEVGTRNGTWMGTQDESVLIEAKDAGSSAFR
jgi:dolichol-phosphate mannosyltransferase